MPFQEDVIYQTVDGRMRSEGAAQYLGLKVKTLAQMRSEGRGPRYVKIGRVFYFKADLDAWIAEAGRVDSTEETRLSKRA
jgi:predicted DNA-binding transcriptional regulator AlpA